MKLYDEVEAFGNRGCGWTEPLRLPVPRAVGGAQQRSTLPLLELRTVCSQHLTHACTWHCPETQAFVAENMAGPASTQLRDSAVR